MRVNIKQILADPEKRKELLTRAIIFIQAVEGRDISKERAEELLALNKEKRDGER